MTPRKPGRVHAMVDKGLSLKVITNAHRLVPAAISTAVLLGRCAYNPCVGIELSFSVAACDEMAVLTRDEFELLLARTPALHEPLIITFVTIGPRWDEATTLTDGDEAWQQRRRRSE